MDQAIGGIATSLQAGTDILNTYEVMTGKRKNYKEKVSIIMPAFRAERFIEAAVQSVLAQTFSDWELIIIDDGSPDRTGEIADRLASLDGRIRVIHRERPSGAPSIPRNSGLELADGRYVAFLDSDDLWYPEKLEKQLPLFSEPDTIIASAVYHRMDAAGTVLSTVPSPSVLDYRTLLKSCFIGFLTSIVDRSRVGDFRFDVDLPYRMQEDMVLWLELLRSGGKVRCLQEPLAAYRITPGSVSRNKGRAARAQWHIYYDLEKLGLARSLYYWFQYGIRGLLRNLDI